MNKRKLTDNTAEEKTSIVKKFQSAEGPHALKAPELHTISSTLGKTRYM